jgi:ribosome-associated toxin RatA of RatAB toxin-antitoxin module
MASTQQELTINAPVERVFEVVTDYEGYSEFLPEITGAEVLSREGDTVVVRFELEIVMRLSYTLELTEVSPTSVRWVLREARMMSSNEGLWELKALGDGTTHATYEVDVRLPGLIPKSVSDRLTGVTLPETLQRFKARCEGATKEADD